MAGAARPRQIDGVRGFAGMAQLNDFLAASRFLVCLLPLTPDTQDILNRDTLSRLQPGGYVINVARGAHLVDDDLIALLDSGHLAGATLDVFRTEPLPPNTRSGGTRKSPSRRTPRRAPCAKKPSRRSRQDGAMERGEPLARLPVWWTCSGY
jgi:glyoxylate/hydroxypyruvate reductase A